MNAIAALSALGGTGDTPALSSLGGAPTRFTQIFEQQVDKVNSDLAAAETSLQKLAAGEPVELHDVMIALETARIGVQTMIQVRNRLVEAYQDVMRMQI